MMCSPTLRPFRRLAQLGAMAVFLMAWIFGCLEQEVEVGEPDSDAADSDSTSRVTVARNGEDVVVDLAGLDSSSSGDGAERVVMAEVIQAAFPSLALADWLCDFVAEDGFRTSAQGEGCEPLGADRTTEAYIELGTRDVFWESSLNMRGCYKPRKLARIELMVDSDDEADGQ